MKQLKEEMQDEVETHQVDRSAALGFVGSVTTTMIL
jgi:hypothetical protein